MDAPRDVAEIVTDELLLVRQKVEAVLSGGGQSIADAQDAYVSAMIGHLFATLLTRFGPGPTPIDKSPARLAEALNTIGMKVSTVAGSLDPRGEYRMQIFRRDRDAE